MWNIGNVKSSSKAQEILFHVSLDYLRIDHIEISKHSFNNYKAIACGAGTTDFFPTIKTPAGNS